MKKKPTYWSKTELKIYILLLCAQADHHASQDEINVIKSKCDADTFDRLYQEFSQDDEETSLQKIETAIGRLEYSFFEIDQLKKEILHIFLADNSFSMTERKLLQILDNILY
ncbi:hypothetical protein U1E44_08635 [Arenibacter sp. GZD96]|uniref:hypothetical protein n=1 Tax=Aurantibrevibacter litoralis TaxID=3106030 RepID=UPI002AFE3E6F|nr:hypothetical protein [Arenibacter sp. GZD-96]MEA1786154.1 hypothetical protein [Arenibacter sp. GZD-96]